jgi:hypothetical protein
MSGCDTLEKLWLVAQNCNIDKPGIDGSIDRASNFVQCSNVRDFMIMTSLKCWNEKNNLNYPPVTIVDIHRGIVSSLKKQQPYHKGTTNIS